MDKPKIVISGINMTEGGIFTILDNCLNQIEIYNKALNYEIVALVADKSRFNYENITYIEFPKSKKNWLFRLYYEYFYFKKLSKKLKPEIWLSLHDISPNIISKKRFVYCHNPNIFYKPSFLEWRLDPKMGIFYLFYSYLYKKNIKKNKAVFVQQNWIKSEFENRFKLDNVQVSKPIIEIEYSEEKLILDNSKIHFFYPSFPRTFKNFEIIYEAMNYLKPDVLEKINIHLTLDEKNANKYTKHLLRKYGNHKNNILTGLLTKNQMLNYYDSIDCLIFPSKLETWGLPISEAKFYKKPIFLAKLEYAKETIGDYENVSFFDIDNPQELAQLITDFVNKQIVFQGNIAIKNEQKSLNGWFELFDYIIKS